MNASDAGVEHPMPSVDASDAPARLQCSLSKSPVLRGASDAYHLTHPCLCVCKLAVGGNGRVQTASDTWQLSEHKTLGSHVRWLTICAFGAHEFCPVKGQ